MKKDIRQAAKQRSWLAASSKWSLHFQSTEKMKFENEENSKDEKKRKKQQQQNLK